MAINWNAAVAVGKLAPKQGFQVWPADTYVMRIDGASWDTTKTGKDRLKIRLQGAQGPKQGQYLFWDLVFTPPIDPSAPGFEDLSDEDLERNAKAVAFFLDRLASVGVSTEFLATGPSQDAIANLIRNTGATFQVTTKVGFFNDQPKTEIKSVKAI